MTRTSARPSALALAAVATALLAATTVAVPAVAAEDVTWGVRTGPTSQGDARQNYSFALDPGARVADALVVTNHGSEPLHLVVYAADGFTTNSGQLDVTARADDQAAIGAWVVPSVDGVDVEPGASATVPFELAVPDSATPGDYAGAIVTSLTSTGTGSVDVERRLGVRIALRVAGDLAPAISVSDAHVDARGPASLFDTGSTTVGFTVTNTGNTTLSAGQTVTLSGPFGLFATTLPAADPTPQLLPGESWDVQLPAAAWYPSFLVHAGITAQGHGPDGLTKTNVAAAETAAVMVPWWAMGALLVLAALVVALVQVLRRRRRAAAGKQGALIEAAVAERLRTQA